MHKTLKVWKVGEQKDFRNLGTIYEAQQDKCCSLRDVSENQTHRKKDRN